MSFPGIPDKVNSLKTKKSFLTPIFISGISSVLIAFDIHNVIVPDSNFMYCPITSSIGFPMHTAGFRLVICRDGHHPPEEQTDSMYIVIFESPSIM